MVQVDSIAGCLDLEHIYWLIWHQSVPEEAHELLIPPAWKRKELEVQSEGEEQVELEGVCFMKVLLLCSAAKC